MATLAQPKESKITSVSVIVPTWNEETQLPACLQSLGDLRDGMEIIVVDGGSTDRTVAIAKSFGARVLASPVRQRATQLNFAATEAVGGALLFLHADTRMPRFWREQILKALNHDAQLAGGAFQRRFDHASLWLRATCALADWRGRAFGLFLGDQAIFVRADAFRRLGGFRLLSQCEDLDFSVRLAQSGRTRLLKPAIATSGRRFLRRGPVRQTLADLVTAVRFLAVRRRAAAEAGSLPPSP